MGTETAFAPLRTQSAGAVALRARFGATQTSRAGTQPSRAGTQTSRAGTQTSRAGTQTSRAGIVHRGAGAPAATLLARLRAHGFDTTVVDTDAATDLLDPEGFDVLVLTGRDSIAEARAQWNFEDDLEWIRRADGVGVRVLGLGHGARALAIALGGDVTPVHRVNRGWTLVDTVAPHLIPPGPWIAWQHDVIVPPAGAVVLAHNNFGPQVLRIGRHLAIQFHPEATVESLFGWLARAGESTDVDSLLQGVRRDPAAAETATDLLLSRFLEAGAVPVAVP
jgi:GMP synthase (glutamine-hydrolysing)